MRNPVLSAVVVLALLAGCKDAPRQTLTEPSEEAAAAVVQAPEREDAGESTLCAAYRNQLGEARVALERSADDESLRESVAAYEAVIADACP